MSPSKIQRTVQAAQQVLAGSQAGGAETAQELADIFRQARRRLAQVADLIERGEPAQAQSLAERSPALSDLVRILGFGKLPQWNARCQQEGWAPAGELDRRHILLLQDCFQVKGPKSPEMADHIRGRILRGDREGAILALKVYLRQHPGDAWAGGELEKLMAAEAVSRFQEMSLFSEQGELGKLAEAYSAFEEMGLEAPPGADLGPLTRKVETFRRKKLEEEMARAVEKLEEWKKRGSWLEACEYGDRLRAEASALGVKLGTRGNLTSLLKWADDCRAEDERKSRVARAEKDLELFLDTFEQARDSRIPLKRGEVPQALAQLRQFRRLAEELRHGWGEKLEGKRIRVEKLLLAEEKAQILRQRLVLGSLVALVVAALAAGGGLAYVRLQEKRQTEEVARMIEKCRTEKSIAEIENYLQGMPPARPGESAAIQHNRARLTAEMERAANLRKELEARIRALEERLGRDPRSWREEAEEFRGINSGLKELMVEHRKELEEKKAGLEKGWLGKTGEQKARSTARVEALVKEVREVLPQIPLHFAVAAERLELLRGRLGDLQAEMGLSPQEIRPSEALVGQLPELKVQVERKLAVAKELQGLRKELEEASGKKDEKKYLAALEKLMAQPEIPAEEKSSMKAVLAWAGEAGNWKGVLWSPRVSSQPGFRPDLPLVLPPVGEVLPKEEEAADKILEVAGLASQVYAYRLPDEKSKVLKTVFSQGKIEETYPNPKGELFARRCRLWNERKGDFERLTNIYLSSNEKNPPYFEEEPLSRLFGESKMKLFCERLAAGGALANRISAVTIADRILKDVTAPGSGKLFLLQKLHELCSLRPEIHDLRFLPWLQEIVVRAADEPPAEENLWLSSTEDSAAKSLWSRLVAGSRANAEAQAAFLQAVAAGGAGTEIVFVGHIGADGLFPAGDEAGAVHLLPPSRPDGGLQLVRGKRDGLRPYTPVYRLKRDPAQIVLDARKKSGVDEATAEGLVREYLPVPAALLYPNR